jgi:hypothetical protein
MASTLILIGALKFAKYLACGMIIKNGCKKLMKAGRSK